MTGRILTFLWLLCWVALILGIKGKKRRQTAFAAAGIILPVIVITALILSAAG